MPHKHLLRLTSARGVEAGLESYKALLEREHSAKSRIATRNGITRRLLGILEQHEKYGHNEIQMQAIRTIISELRKAKTPKQIERILMITCLLKQTPAHLYTSTKKLKIEPNPHK
ncbi:MAG: hypothetical protein WCW44_06585 [archaeon]|jgi:hypothetical protein